VTTVLVAMRSPEHVDENLATAEREPAKPEVIHRLFARARKRAAGS
jgi:aryl-alcohol dehydrogenase-like predicted oxidoreductase